MTAPRAVKAVALVAAALMLLVLGAALRPLFAPENHTQRAVLSETEIGFVHDMAAHHQQALFILARLSPDVDPGGDETGPADRRCSTNGNRCHARLAEVGRCPAEQ